MYISIKRHSCFFKSWWCLLYFGHVQTRTASKCWRQKTPFCLKLSTHAQWCQKTPFCLKLSTHAQKSVLSWSISMSRILGYSHRVTDKECNPSSLLYPPPLFAQPGWKGLVYLYARMMNFFGKTRKTQAHSSEFLRGAGSQKVAILWGFVASPTTNLVTGLEKPVFESWRVATKYWKGFWPLLFCTCI